MNKDELTTRLGEGVHALKGTPHWSLLLEIKDWIMKEQSNPNNFWRSVSDKPLMMEPELGQIIMHRKGMLDGVNEFFSTMQRLMETYLKGEKK